MKSGIVWSEAYSKNDSLHNSKSGMSVQVERPGSLPKEWSLNATTVMLKNIPNRYTQEDLLHEITSHGFHSTFDYFHLVMDMNTKRNKGFAFLNMYDSALARQMYMEFNGMQLQKYSTQKVVEVKLASSQGLSANVISYLNTHADRVQNVWFKPIIFRRTPEWTAMPLILENVPQEVLQDYRNVASDKLSKSFTKLMPQAGASPAKNEERSAEARETQDQQRPSSIEDELDGDDSLLNEDEYDEILCQVQRYLKDPDGEEQEQDGEEELKIRTRRGHRGRGSRNRIDASSADDPQQKVDGVDAFASSVALPLSIHDLIPAGEQQQHGLAWSSTMVPNRALDVQPAAEAFDLQDLVQGRKTQKAPLFEAVMQEWQKREQIRKAAILEAECLEREVAQWHSHSFAQSEAAAPHEASTSFFEYPPARTIGMQPGAYFDTASGVFQAPYGMPADSATGMNSPMDWFQMPYGMPIGGRSQW